MYFRRLFVCTALLCLLTSTRAGAQTTTRPVSERTDTARAAVTDASAGQPQLATPAQTNANAPASVPRLIRFSGILQNLAGKALSGPVDVTFSLYAEEAGGPPLWFETQTVQTDSLGRYSVLLGAMSPSGVPMELFTEGQARWLGVMVQGLPEPSRVLLVSVPYALKAGDAETLGGRPAAAYQLAPESAASPDSVAKQGTTTTAHGTKKAITKSGSPTPQTLTATQNYIPVMTANDGSLGNSVMYQTGGFIGVGTTAPAFPFDLNNNVFAIGPKSSRPGAGGTMRFRDDSGTVRWSFGVPGTAGATDFFLYNNVNGHAPFYVQSGAASYSLYLNANGNVGIGTTTPVAKLDVAGNINIPQTTTAAAGLLTIGGVPFLHACCNGSFLNTFVGPSAGNLTTAGTANVGVGWVALSGLTTGASNTASGFNALGTDNTGSGNAAFGASALSYNTSGGANTAVGGNAGVASATGSHNTFLGGATGVCRDGVNYGVAIGFGALVCQNNSMALGGTGTYAVKVGIGTTTPQYSLDVVGAIHSSNVRAFVTATDPQNTTSSSFVQVPGLSVTFTASGLPLLIIANIGGANADGDAAFEIVLDGTTVLDTQAINGTVSNEVPMVTYDSSVTAGSHTVAVYWRCVTCSVGTEVSWGNSNRSLFVTEQ